MPPPRVVETFFGDNMLKGDVETIRGDIGSKFLGAFSGLCDEHRTRSEFTHVGISQYNNSFKGYFGIFDPTQKAGVLIPDADV